MTAQVVSGCLCKWLVRRRCLSLCQLLWHDAPWYIVTGCRRVGSSDTRVWLFNNICKSWLKTPARRCKWRLSVGVPTQGCRSFSGTVDSHRPVAGLCPILGLIQTGNSMILPCSALLSFRGNCGSSYLGTQGCFCCLCDGIVTDVRWYIASYCDTKKLFFRTFRRWRC